MEIYKLIFKEDDITWQSLIYELVREGKIDPWDVDISVLTKEYIGMIKKLKELNFRLSGKVVLAAAILLKLKSDRLGLQEFIQLTEDQLEQEELPEPEPLPEDEKRFTKASLKLRIPGVRKRAVTATELIAALHRAIEVDERRQRRLAELVASAPKVKRPTKINIFEKIQAVWERIVNFIRQKHAKKIQFNELVPSKEKKDIIWTFIPLLHLANQNKLELQQERPFGQIFVLVKNGSRIKSKD